MPPVHPRRRGERRAHQIASSTLVGSSPQARGTARHVSGQLQDGRFIPAGAGNGSRTRRTSTWTRVHPRRRGERQRFEYVAGADTGSSPQARGTGLGRLPTLKLGRFIPAGAGNGVVETVVHEVTPVHPRRRGERVTTPVNPVIDDGSSPQARGTERLLSRVADTFRFIPAGAGNGRGGAPGAARGPVHPRRRGERTNCILLMSKSLPVDPKSTAEFGPVQRLYDRVHSTPSCSGGENLTSFNPSKSSGILRLVPTVSKSKPWSVGAVQQISPSPSPMPPQTCSQIRSRTRAE